MEAIPEGVGVGVRIATVSRPRAELRDVSYREVMWTSIDGRKYVKAIPPDADSSMAAVGMTVGPPEGLTDDLPGLTDQQAVDLHNCLVSRGILTWEDARRRRTEIEACVKQAIDVHVDRLLERYFIP